MSNNYEKLSNDVVHVLVDSILKKHDVRLEPGKIDREEKEQIVNMINNFKKSIEELNIDHKEKSEE